jgi:DNA-binding transcriptional ArsR family regulator
MQVSSSPTAPISQDQSELDVKSLADMFKALSDPNRLRIVFALLGSDGGQNVGQTAGCCEVDLSVVSRHLSVLRRAGILVREKRGKQVIYHIDRQRLPAVLRTVADVVEQCCLDVTHNSPNEGNS